MRRRGVLVAMLCMTFAACAMSFRGGPGAEDMARANFGPAPENPEESILTWMNDTLKDPFSAQLEILAPPEKSWWGNLGSLLYPRDIHYCWLIKSRINAKNSFGGYIGWKRYNFFFRDGKIEFVQE